MFLLIIMIIIFFNSTDVSANHFWLGDTLSLDQIKARWGSNEFNMKRFRLGNYQIRASMANSLLRQKNKFKEITAIEVKEKFGRPDGFYFTDVFPAYIIQPSYHRGDDVWQIVFSLDSQRKVTNIFVHKSCCYKVSLE